MSEFADKIKEWVQMDNRVKQLNDEMKRIRSDRNELSDTIIQYANSNNLEHAVIQISDGKLKFQNTRVPQALTLKFVKQCLEEYFGTNTNVDDIISFIKEKREVKCSNDIKRYYS